METVKFEMDNTGVKLKSEAAIIAKMTALLPSAEPRYFYFDDTFVLFLKEKGKDKPYFIIIKTLVYGEYEEINKQLG